MQALGYVFAVFGGLMVIYGILLVTPTSAMHQIYQAVFISGGLVVIVLGLILACLAEAVETLSRKRGPPPL